MDISGYNRRELITRVANKVNIDYRILDTIYNDIFRFISSKVSESEVCEFRLMHIGVIRHNYIRYLLDKAKYKRNKAKLKSGADDKC